MNNNSTPTYNMKVVVQETGLKPDTLRAWERRYGVPNPQRTPGGHRLYSQSEIEMLKWLIQRQDDGLSISRAVEMWNTLVEAGDNPLQSVQTEEEKSDPKIVPGSQIEDLRNAWIDACLDFNEHKAQAVLAQTFALFPMEVVCFEILQKGLIFFGEGWYEGRISVQQEHFASVIAIRQLEALLASMPEPTRSERILIALPPDELHTFSPLLLSVMFRRRGWDVIYLGANVPVERLESALRSIEPELVIIPAQTLHTAGTMLPMAKLLEKEGVPMAFGGAVFAAIPNATNYIPGHFLGNDLKKVPDRVDNLLRKPRLVPAAERASRDYQKALAAFRSHRAGVESRVHEMINNSGFGELPPKHISNANEDFGNNISAALMLGDINLITANLEWVHGFLVNFHYRMPEQALPFYLQCYREALAAEIDDNEVEIILEWFDKFDLERISV
jgi:DNA-binding transcriptional MerR regulator